MSITTKQLYVRDTSSDPRLKALVVRSCDAAGAFPIGHRLWRARHGAAYIRALNYHSTPIDAAPGLAAQLAFYRGSFVDAGPSELAACLAGNWQTDKPGILLSFDNGYRSNYEIAAPILERHGFTGWFFVPAGYVADANGPRRTDRKGREFMTWTELADLAARGHVIGCHSHSHRRLPHGTAREVLEDEIVAAKARLEAGLGAPVESFCWVGGEEWSYSAEAARLIRAAGYRWSFTTNLSVITSKTDPHVLDRTNVEAEWPIEQVRFYLSGIMDLAYTGKRRRLARKFGIGGRPN